MAIVVSAIKIGIKADDKFTALSNPKCIRMLNAESKAIVCDSMLNFNHLFCIFSSAG